MIGESFGKLKVVDKAGKNKRNEYLWLCKCECGGEKIIKSYNLKIGKTKSCGCLKTVNKPIDRAGEKIGLFTLLEYVGRDKNRISLWMAKCDCGNIKTIRSNTRIKSCGCLKKIKDNQRFGNKNPNWNSSLSDEDRINNRNIEGYDNWSLGVKKKYNFTCIVCNDNSGGNLVSHHLESYSHTIDKRVDIKNGVCLCNKCHIDFHKKYGYKKNTREQFFDYLNKLSIFVEIL